MVFIMSPPVSVAAKMRICTSMLNPFDQYMPKPIPISAMPSSVHAYRHMSLLSKNVIITPATKK